jgi:hypothetical protein
VIKLSSVRDMEDTATLLADRYKSVIAALLLKCRRGQTEKSTSFYVHRISFYQLPSWKRSLIMPSLFVVDCQFVSFTVDDVGITNRKQLYRRDPV